MGLGPLLLGIDVHPQFQAGLNIETVRAEGFDFMACKVSQGTGVYDSRDWLRRGQACGLLCLGYHYLEPGNEVAQARVFAAQLKTAGVPGMVDAEFPTPTGDTLTVAGIRAFIDAARGFGARIPLLYLPHWYWQRMGSPDLGGLPNLWGSSYVNGGGFASALYQAVLPSYWAPYGQLPMSVLQFTDKAVVAGQSIDADAYLGTRDQLASLLGGSVTTPADIWNVKLDDPYVGPDGKKSDPKTVGDFLRWSATHAAYAKEQAIAARADVATVRKEVEALQSGLNAFDLELDTRIKAAIAAAVVAVTVNVNGKPLPTSS